MLNMVKVSNPVGSICASNPSEEKIGSQTSPFFFFLALNHVSESRYTSYSHVRHTALAVNTASPPLCSSNLLPARCSQSEENWLQENGAKTTCFGLWMD